MKRAYPGKMSKWRTCGVSHGMRVEKNDSTDQFLMHNVWNSSDACLIYGSVEDGLTPTARSNASRSSSYSALYEAVRRMARMPLGHDFYLDPTTALKAEEVLAVLANNFDAPAPKLIPHEGDSVVLAWDAESIKRYLTIDAEEMDLMLLHKESKIHCDHQVLLDASEGWLDEIRSIGGNPATSTNEMERDAS